MRSSDVFVLLAGIAAANPIARDIFYNDSSNDMYSVIAGDSPCQPVALIFARGTFDSGNVGVWVGPPLINSLTSILPSSSLAAQGVDGTLYPATLSGYLSEGGSNDGATALQQTVTSYAHKCPESAIVITGWSQGALVAHKGIAQLEPDVLERVAGLVTFGDPWHLFSDEPLPAALNESTVKGYCFNGAAAFDPLCADLPTGYDVPDTMEGITTPFLRLPSIAHGAQQVKAAASLVLQFPLQLLKSWSSFAGDLNKQDFVKLLLTPQHFQYGNSGSTTEAAEFISMLPLVQEVLNSRQ